MPMFGSYFPGATILPQRPVPVDMRELGPLPLARDPGRGEIAPDPKEIENKALYDLLLNRPSFGFGKRPASLLPLESMEGQASPVVPQRQAPAGVPQQRGNDAGPTWADRLIMAGAALQGRPDLVMHYRQTLFDRQQEAERRAAQSEFGDRFSGAYSNPGSGADPLQAILPDLLRLQAMGVNVGDYARLADTMEARGRRSAYINSLPPEARAEAELDPSGYAGWERERRTPSFHAVGPGTSIVGVNRATGQASPLFSNPRPTEPLSTDQLVAGVLGKAQSGAELNPTEQSILNRYLFGADNTNDRPSPNSVVGRILDKFTRGEALSPQEEEIRGRYMTGTLSMTDQLVQQMLPQMGGLPETGAGAPPATPPPRVPQKGAAGGNSRDNPARPRTRAEAEALPPGTWIMDPKGNVFPKR